MKGQNEMPKPKKYYLRTNRHGNLDSQPKDKRWIEFGAAGLNRRKASHRHALNSGRIFTYEVCVGFNGSNRRGWSPVLESIIHLDQIPLFRRLVAQYEKQKEREKSKTKREQARLRKTPEYRAAERERQEIRKQKQVERLAETDRQNRVCVECKIPADSIGRILVRELRDVREAHPDWLDDAYHALAYSLRHDGVMARCLDGDGPGFHHALCLAIGAYRRHEFTNYEDLLDNGLDRDTARAFAEQINP